jgi:hypothetical protein
MTTKQAIKTPKATDNEIILAFDHQYIEPPSPGSGIVLELGRRRG